MSNISIRGEILVGLCLTAGIITIIYQRKNKSKLLSKNKVSNEKSLCDYSYRDLFHFFIAPEFHYDKLHFAKEFSEQMHIEASKYMMMDHDDDPDFADHFTYIKYDKEKINERLDYIQERLFKQRYLDWLDAGQPVDENSYYWWAETKLHLITYLIQREPYHLTDGIWLRGVPQGPMTYIDSKLFSIYIDELGNGDVSQNHPSVYLNVLKDLELYVPPITSREFVDQKQILDISFKKPLLTLTTSLFPKTFTPEILGYTLWLETTSSSEHSGLRKILDRYDLNPKFSLLHNAIDNNLDGHGKYARDAVQLYLDDILQKEGRQAVEHHWKRIWTGYVAYGTTGNIDNELKALYKKQKQITPKQEFIELIKKKSILAQKMHGARRIGPNNCLLNDLFSSNDPEKLLYELENSDMIVKGYPHQSKLLNHAVTFQGPMYQVFNADELSIITRWIISLLPSTINDVLSLLVKRRKLAKHLSTNVKLQLPDGSEEYLKDLFEKDPSELLSAFRVSKWNIPFDGSNVTKENVDTCPLIKSIDKNGILEHVFNRYDNDKEILSNWILEGSPIQNETSQDQSKQINIISQKPFQFQY
ncbi:unnamed protein product [Adineta steineri]|uniref:Uncharacterized protein n=1 Tax=Adineta steineri TaxID=433720 RepID=A0A813Z9F1_9BILA|nr:unnamed protein product [Adineta steineri]